MEREVENGINDRYSDIVPKKFSAIKLKNREEFANKEKYINACWIKGQKN